MVAQISRSRGVNSVAAAAPPRTKIGANIILGRHPVDRAGRYAVNRE